jgi:hypothetical protein
MSVFDDAEKVADMLRAEDRSEAADAVDALLVLAEHGREPGGVVRRARVRLTVNPTIFTRVAEQVERARQIAGDR